MPHFVKRIKTEPGPLNFYFNTIYTSEGMRYYVSVVGRDKKVYSFMMKFHDGSWVLSDSGNCPYWVSKIEAELSKLIEEYRED